MKSHKTLMNHNDKMLDITWNNFDDILDNIIWDDSTGELHSRWSKIFFSSHVENAILNRCYFINEISDPVDTI